MTTVFFTSSTERRESFRSQNKSTRDKRQEERVCIKGTNGYKVEAKTVVCVRVSMSS